MARPFRVFDTDLDEEYPEHTMYAAAYEPIWHTIRGSTHGKWTTYVDARVCCARLQVYMDRALPGNDQAVKVWRSFNLLNAIPYSRVTVDGIHGIEYAAADYILAYADTVRKRYHAGPYATEWDWAISRRGLQYYCKKDPSWVLVMYNQLRIRPLRNGRIKPELAHYLLMIAEALISVNS